MLLFEHNHNRTTKHCQLIVINKMEQLVCEKIITVFLNVSVSWQFLATPFKIFYCMFQFCRVYCWVLFLLLFFVVLVNQVVGMLGKHSIN